MRVAAITFTLLFAVVGCGRIGYASLTGATDASSDALDLGDASVDADLDFDSPDLTMSGVVVVESTSTLTTSEAGASASFTVRLASMPAANATISLSSSDSTEGRVTPPVLLFTPMNWNAPQVVTVRGVDDSDVDGTQVYSVVIAPVMSSDSVYNGVDAADVSVENTDNETAGVTLSALTGLSTTESGSSATFTVALNAAPGADVTIALSTSDVGEAIVDPASLTFTNDNWASAQTVSVTGVDDLLVDGDQPFTVVTANAVSPGSAYDDLEVDDVAGVNHDNETPGILVEPLTLLTTSETGDTASFTVVLLAAPEHDVLVPVTSTDTTEGTLGASAIVFTPDNWSVPQSVNVTGVDDVLADGDQAYSVTIGPAVGADAPYTGLSGPSVSLANTDNDSASFVVTPSSTLITTELGGADTFTVSLNTQPVGDVVFDITSSDLTEATVSPAQLTFTNADWATPQTVTITGVDDAVIDGDQDYSVLLQINPSSDTAYVGLADRTVLATNTDNETAGVTISPASGLTTTEFGGTAEFTVVLNSAPAASVIIRFTSDLISEGTLASSTVSLSFSPATWNVPQIVTITGIDDPLVDGARVYHIITAPIVSADPQYGGLNIEDITVVNTDNDSVGVNAVPIAISATEGGPGVSFSVSLNSQPTASVTVPWHIGNASQGSISVASQTFTPSNWATPQSITVTATNDAVVDGDYLNAVISDAASSADLLYNGVNGADVEATMVDNDVAGVLITPATTGFVTTELGTSATIFVRLSSQPMADVTISLMSSDTTEGTVSTSLLTFTPANWSAAHAFAVTGVNDALVDGNIAYQVITGSTVSTDAAYSGIDVPDISLTNVDRSMPAVVPSPLSGLTTTELGMGAATFTIVLTTMPTADVTVGLTSSDLTEGTVSPASVTFTGANWSTPQTVTVTGVDDSLVDGSVLYQIVTSAAVSADPSYAGRAVNDVTLTNTDDEPVGVVVTNATGTNYLWEGGSSVTLNVHLLSQPVGSVVVPFSNSGWTNEMSVSPASLTFTSGNWNVDQTVTVSSVDDLMPDGDRTVYLGVMRISTGSGGYLNYDAPDISFVNLDDDAMIPAATSGGSVVASIAPSRRGLSATGRYLLIQAVAYISLVPEDTNGAVDVYVVDRATKSFTLVSKNAAGVVGNSHSFVHFGAMTQDASYVAFSSAATNLGGSDTNGLNDVYVKNMATGAVVRASLSNMGAEPNADCFALDISADGRYVLFQSAATNLVASDTNSGEDVFLRDTVAGTTMMIDVSSAGVQGNATTNFAMMSSDARFVLFTSPATNLVPGDTNACADVFVRDTLFNTTTRVSVSSTGAELSNYSTGTDISADGRYIAITSGALVLPTDPNSNWRVYVRDQVMGTFTRVSMTSGGAQPNGLCGSGSVSDDGQMVTFSSNASDIVPGDTNGVSDIFAHNLTTGVVARVSVGASAQQPNQALDGYAISGDGRYALFDTAATNIWPTGGWVWGTVIRLPR